MARKASLKSLKKKAWNLCSRYIRTSAADSAGYVTCYTCNTRLHWKEAQAGHAIPGRGNAVLLDKDVIRPQCYACNIARDGMHHIFSTKLIKEHGMEWWEAKLFNARRSVKLDRSNLESLIAHYEALI